MYFIRTFIPALLLFISINGVVYGSDAHVSKPWEYQLGKGLRVADTGFRLGGYLSLKYTDADNSKGKFVFDDLSLFIFGDVFERVKFFLETEDAHFLEIDTDGNVTRNHNGQLERLYLDYLLSDTFKIRAGKFLTPVGTWNEIHVDPLTWTVSRPLVTTVTFPEFTTGIQLFGDFSLMDEDLEYSLFLQNNEGINERTGFRKTHLMYGGKIKWFAQTGLEAGIPFLYYTEYSTDNRIYLTGLDIRYKKKGVEIRSEAAYSHVESRNGGNSKEYGYYLQGVYDLTERLFLIGRHEYLNSRSDEGELRIISIGGAYKPVPPVVFKIEYQIRSGDLRFNTLGVDNSEQFLASFSILF